MSRYRWLLAEWPVSIGMLATRIKARQFTERSSHGFVIDRVRDDYLEGRYVERVEFEDTVVDPFGNEEKFPRVEFRQSGFRASSEWPGLELIDPPRTAQGLLNRLSEALDFEVVIGAISVDVLRWADSFQQVAGVETIVDSLQIGSLQIEQGVLGKVVIKGDRDVRSAAFELTQHRKFALEKIQLRIPGRSRGAVVLTNVGAVKISVEEAADTVLPALRQSLAHTLAPAP